MGYGTVYKLEKANNWTIATLHDFAYADGATPSAALLADSAGNLYGTTYDGGAGGTGVVFRIAHAIDRPPVAVADTYQVLTGATLSVSAPGLLANDTDAGR